MPRAALTGWIVPILDAISEGAWLAVVDAAVEPGFGTHRSGWGPLPFAIAAGAGLAWIRRPHRPTVSFIGLLVLTLSAAVIAAATSLGTPVISTLTPASAMRWLIALLGEPVGWIAALAVARGTQQRVRSEDDETISRLLTLGLPALALPWLAGSLQAPATRTLFIGVALPATVLFVAAGLLALGLARLEVLRDAGTAGSGSRSVIVLLAMVVLAVAIVAIPASVLLGDPITLLALAIFGPIHALLSPLADVLYQVLLFLLSGIGLFAKAQPGGGSAGGEPLAPPSNLPSPALPAPGSSPIGIILAAAIVGIILIASLVLLSRQRRSPVRAASAIVEERRLRPPALALRWPGLPRLPRREAVPRTATQAYLAALRQLDERPLLARRENEGPAAHVERLRRAGIEPEALPLLAADYQLERYGDRQLSSAETSRAISRWRRLRARLARSHSDGTDG